MIELIAFGMFVILIGWIAFLSYKEETNKVKQRTFIHCSCGNELISAGDLVEDVYENGVNHCRFKCSKCGEESDFDFDHPVPLPNEERTC